MAKITFDPNTIAKSAEINSNFEGTWNGQNIDNEAIKKKHLDPQARIDIRTFVSDNQSTLVVNVNNYDMFIAKNLSSNITIANPTGEPVDGQGILIRIKDNGTARTITYGGLYRAVGVTLPTATLSNRVMYLSARYNADDTRWDIVSVGRLL